MNAGELCNRTVYIIRENETVLEAARLMKKYHVGCLVVVEERGEDRVPVALVTDRDLVVKGLAEDGLSLSDIRTIEINPFGHSTLILI